MKSPTCVWVFLLNCSRRLHSGQQFICKCRNVHQQHGGYKEGDQSSSGGLKTIIDIWSRRTRKSSQPRLPSYGTQVTVQAESEKQFDKLRRKEEKKQKHGTDPGFDMKGPTHQRVTALPQGTTRKHHKGYEEVSIPPTQIAPMKPGENLIEIKEWDEFAQDAFHGYKSLNRIQIRIFQTTYHTNENILVCAPTGAGKTKIAMIAILHETFSKTDEKRRMWVRELKYHNDNAPSPSTTTMFTNRPAVERGQTPSFTTIIRLSFLI